MTTRTDDAPPGLAHLLPPVRQVLSWPERDRIRFAYTDRWIEYPAAGRALAAMGDLLVQPNQTRMRGVLVAARPDNGKTSVLRRFLDLHPVTARESGESNRPVVLASMPDEPSEAKLWSNVLRALVAPHRSSDSARHLREHPMLREGLGLPPAALPVGLRLYIELLRTDARVALLETVAAWLADWPAGFRAGAAAAGMTQRTFARSHVPGAFAAEVARLPHGNQRDNAWKPILEEPVLKRLRREDPAKYRAVRAERIIEVVGRAQYWDPRSYPEYARKEAAAPDGRKAARLVADPQGHLAGTGDGTAGPPARQTA